MEFNSVVRKVGSGDIVILPEGHFNDGDHVRVTVEKLSSWVVMVAPIAFGAIPTRSVELPRTYATRAAALTAIKRDGNSNVVRFPVKLEE